jgi:hypothetical protein
MPKTRDTKAEKPDTVLLKAATTIGRAAGKLVGLVSRNSAENPARKTRVSQSKRQAGAKKQTGRKKIGPSRNTKVLSNRVRRARFSVALSSPSGAGRSLRLGVALF